MNRKYIKFKVKDISLAEWGRKEIRLAEAGDARINVNQKRIRKF